MPWKPIRYNMTGISCRSGWPRGFSEDSWFQSYPSATVRIRSHFDGVAVAWQAFSISSSGAASPRYKNHAIWNHGSSVWTKALSCMVFVSAQPARAINYYPVCTVNIACIALCCNSMRAMSLFIICRTLAKNCLLSDIIERWLSTWFPMALETNSAYVTARIKQKCALYWQFWFWNSP